MEVPLNLKISELESAAYAFAVAAHAGQTRKYTNDPYICHPAHVVGIMKEAGITLPSMLAAAWLHDAVEDNPAITKGHIRLVFGGLVADIVDELTDALTPEDGNRKFRKAAYRDKLANASYAAKTIKLADLISNTASIAEYDPGFAKVYMQEKRELLDVLTDRQADLYRKAQAIVDEYFSKKAA